jgi:hypothetical protein
LSTLPEPAASQRHSDSANKREPLDRNAVITPITPEDSTKTTAHYLARRLRVVFTDLGLLEHIPSDWLQPGPDGLSFRPLSVREADKLTLAVEELAHDYRPRRPRVSPDQLPLF